MTDQLTSLETIPEVFEALGGIPAVCDIIGATGKRAWQRVDNYRLRGRLASDTYVVLTKALEERGYSAPPSLWGMIDPPPPAESDQPQEAVQ
jgi:hypothetical protein